jgi:small subunit ribosomal protein S5
MTDDKTQTKDAAREEKPKKHVTGDKTVKEHVKAAEKVTAKKEESISEDGEEKEEIESAEIVEEVVSQPVAVVDAVEDEKDLKKKILKDKKKLVEFEDVQAVWTPRTELGQKVKDGEITSLHDIMRQSAPIKEVEIVNQLLPSLGEEVLDVGRVQRVTDSGRRMRFRVVTAVGNNDGYVGVGEAKGKEAGPTIRKSIDRAKTNIVEVKRACGSWECGCGQPHTVPFKVTGKAGSVEVTLVPAPRGVGIVSGKIAKIVLSLAGIKDVWVLTDGHTRSGINFAHAVVNALENTNYVKLNDEDTKRLGIVTGATASVKKPEEKPEEAKQ